MMVGGKYGDSPNEAAGTPLRAIQDAALCEAWRLLGETYACRDPGAIDRADRIQGLIRMFYSLRDLPEGERL